MKMISIWTILALCLLGVCSGSASTATAASVKTNLKSIQIGNDGQIDLGFDGIVDQSQIKTEFNNDIIQLTLSNVRVYPAKILPGNGEVISKIFAYQYAPQTVRCRFTVKGNAEDYKNRLEITPNGKSIAVRVSQGQTGSSTTTDISSATSESARVVPELPELSKFKDKVVTSQASVVRAETSISRQADSKNAINADTQEDDIRLSEKISAPAKQNDATQKIGGKSENKTDAILESSLSEGTLLGSQPSRSGAPPSGLGSGKAIPSIGSAVLKLLGVLFLFLVVAAVVLRYKPFFVQLASRMTASGLINPLNKNSEKLIEVIATHRLDPKKNITIIKIGKKQFVLGVTADSINLLTELKSGPSYLSSDLDEDRNEDHSDLEDDSEGFSSLLNNERGKPLESNVRSRIKSRLEGLKQL